MYVDNMHNDVSMIQFYISILLQMNTKNSNFKSFSFRKFRLKFTDNVILYFKKNSE